MFCPIEQTSRIVWRWIAGTAICMLLAACGGGGGEQEPLRRAPLPELSENRVPTGDRIDVASRDFFVAVAGDRTEYFSTTPGGQLITVVREVALGPSADGRVSFRESIPGSATETPTPENYQRRAEGLFHLDPWGPDAPSGLRGRVAELLMYPTPFYTVGSVRTVVRQGDLGIDLDGDAYNESFRFEFEQTFVGFETGTRGGRAELRAKFRNRTLLRIEPSRIENAPVEAATTEVALFAERTGLISSELASTGAGSNLAPHTGLRSLSKGTIAGRDINEAWNGSRTRIIALQHHDLAYDAVGGVYYAGTTARDAMWPGRVVRVDPRSGAMQASPALGNDVRSIALTADGRSLYAGVYNRNEIVRLALPDLTVIQTISLPPGTWAFSLAVSPRDAGTIAFFLDNFGGARLARNGVLQPAAPTFFSAQPQSTADPSMFSDDGTQWFLFGRGSSIDSGLLPIPVLPDGLGNPGPTVPILLSDASIDRSPAGLVLGNSLHDAGTLARQGGVRRTDLTKCRPLPASTRWVCRHDPSVSDGWRRVGVVDTATYELVPDGLIPYDSPAAGVYGPGGPTVRVVPGPVGQVAMMIGGEGFWFGDWIALVDSPDFR